MNKSVYMSLTAQSQTNNEPILALLGHLKHSNIHFAVLSLTIVPSIKTYRLRWVMRSKLISAGPYLGILAHQFLPDRSGKPIPCWRTSSSSGCGRRWRRTIALSHPAGRERMVRWGECVNSWAWCLQKCMKHNGCLAKEDICSGYQTDIVKVSYTHLVKQ